MPGYVASASLYVSGSDVNSEEDAEMWIDRAQKAIDRIDDEYGMDVIITLRLPDEPNFERFSDEDA